MDAAVTWMIGNSPKSDMNPALEAGLNAVFVPHAHTWVLEKQELRAGKQLLVVEKFGRLARGILETRQTLTAPRASGVRRATQVFALLLLARPVCRPWCGSPGYIR